MRDEQVDATDSATARPWMLYTDRQRWAFLAILFLVSTSNYFDRNVMSVLLEPIRQEFGVSDTMLGLLTGICFALLYAIAGMPVARWADRGDRRTIITLAVVVWSVMTVFCGLAQTFSQLAIARVGVGIGESGAIPPAQSLVADYYPPERRATAIAILTGAATTGYLLGIGLGGYLAASNGWRSVFIMAGAPGVLFAMIARLFLKEPRLALGFTTNSIEDRENLKETFARLIAKRSFLYAFVGCLLYFFYAYSVLSFVPAFLLRVLHASLTRASVTYGTVEATASLLGTLGGGWLADRSARSDIRWLAWIPAIAFVVSGLIYIGSFAANDLGSFMVLDFLASVILAGGLPPVFAAIHAVCGSRRRATAIAIVIFSATLFGGGVGPLVSGALSDAFGAKYGTEGLRYSLASMMTLLIAAGGALYYSGQAIPSDLED